jgi:Meiotically up-regulated gene 113
MSEGTMKPWQRRQERLEQKLADMRRANQLYIDKTVGRHGYPHVYFAYSAGRIKIGTSLYPECRGKDLSLQSPHPVTIVMTVDGGYDLEQEFHRLFDSLREHGEWFRLSDEMRRFLHQTLCRTGVRKLGEAEASFKEWLADMGLVFSATAQFG